MFWLKPKVLVKSPRVLVESEKNKGLGRNKRKGFIVGLHCLVLFCENGEF
jgi:hypothetical protein